MVKGTFSMVTEVVGSEDGMHTYSINRSWGESGRKGLVIELYPTITAERSGSLDVSTMHLLNHCSDLGWESGVSVVNLYSTVFSVKPLTSMLSADVENLAYIEDLLDKAEIADCDIAIAWGNSFASHTVTNEAKYDLLSMLMKRGLDKQVKCVVTDSMNTDRQIGVHPLFLGLHYGKETWRLADYPIQGELKALEEVLNRGKEPKEAEKKEDSKPAQEKKKGGRKKDVSTYKEPA